MARDFYTFKESLVVLRGGAHLSGVMSLPMQLGLAEKGIVVTPRWRHGDIKYEEFGDIPPEVRWKLADVNIRMTLVHYDQVVLDTMMMQAAAGGCNSVTSFAGLMAPAGALMGNNLPLFASGNYFVSVNLIPGTSPDLFEPYRFPSCYLTGPAVEYPLGTTKSLVVLNIRAIPYTPYPPGSGQVSPIVFNNSGLQVFGGQTYLSSFGEPLSSGAILWDRTYQS